MAWIESHQKLERHPKTLDLMNRMGWDLDTTLGKLHRFWWWCVDFAEDGDLRKHNDTVIASAVGLNSTEAQRFKKAMVESRWIDQKPYFRVHDWWDFLGLFLQRKYGKKHPEKYQIVRDLYSDCTVTVQKAVRLLKQPNLTKPNQTKPKTLLSNSEFDGAASGKDFLNQAREILVFLNRKTNHSYRPVPANTDLIVARLKSGIEPKQLRQVIAMKAREWGADDKMAAFLRPKTLFSRGNFENYIGQLGSEDL